MNIINRRAFLKLLSFCGLALVRRSEAAKIGYSAGKFPDRQTLSIYLDTLIPADITPSATELKIDELLTLKADRNRAYATLLTQGCNWLDQQARNRSQQSFKLLPENERIAIIASAESGDPRSLASQFYFASRNDAFFHYYAHPKSQTCLTNAGTPQPLGYPDHNKAPQENTTQCL